ncbi:MAG: tRNA preQ1(34) S-adenosylmethionine ribosyltransferase-isomerase QueA [Deltaproteobacteria bacterium]|nr:tRNA preQ1(34) S-adenosylmethionine ribosyltransferase-isomerase QueA [Deltaproteobacteria bacterium]
MLTNDFNYAYPDELVAQQPLAQRDASRMMIVDRKKHSTDHRSFSELPLFVGPGDCLVINNSRVIPARLFGTRSSGAPIELLLAERTQGSDTTHEVWRCLTKKAKRVRVGEQFFFGKSAIAEAIGHEEGALLVAFDRGHRARAVERCGVPPLPPYIKRKDPNDYVADRERYQTIFAETSGSAAAPTAGLHFSEAMLAAVATKGAHIAPITLHVGLDTFRPVMTEKIEDHHLHGEHFSIPEKTAEAIMKAKQDGHRVIACGTTSVRALESAWRDGRLESGEETTKLFITPGFSFQVVDALLTNFHQPKSTLLMMVSAFAGREFILDCYAQAIREKYRLFSYGDCMLIL